jgi:hypothetical protein
VVVIREGPLYEGPQRTFRRTRPADKGPQRPRDGRHEMLDQPLASALREKSYSGPDFSPAALDVNQFVATTAAM